ncbi:cation:proton antiporter [Sphingomonas sp. URHD0057]|uniref:cation:proton antiporter n=1 Tax=Sphingomonas sp. URHD0057 TaxID=1380389 RepID=UPI00048B4FD8|nr:cation:proton antiporter [Sphingomonas sp. URHD0057]
MTGASLAPIGVLLLVACLIAMLTRKIGLPYIVGLVVAGFAIALLPNAPQLPLSRALIFNVLLPPLVFEAALQLEWKRFRDELPLTLTLAFAGVAIAAAVVAAGMHYAVGWSWIGAALFGVLIAATDPVSVIAAFREMNCAPRVSMVVESESLLNDGVAAVGFAVLSAIAAGASASAASVVPEFLWTLGGGVAIGLAVSGVILLIVGRTNDPLVEITLTTIAAYGSFLLAEDLHASGIISALAAGLVVGNLGWGAALSEEGKTRVLHAWEYFAFLANSLIFILIGLNTASLPLLQLGAVGAIAIVLVLLGRAISIYPLAALFSATRWKLPASYQHTLFWGGLRGALALALALAVPPSVPERTAIIVVAFVVVGFSILVQGLTMPWLIKRLSLTAVEAPEARR